MSIASPIPYHSFGYPSWPFAWLGKVRPIRYTCNSRDREQKHPVFWKLSSPKSVWTLFISSIRYTRTERHMLAAVARIHVNCPQSDKVRPVNTLKRIQYFPSVMYLFAVNWIILRRFGSVHTCSVIDQIKVNEFT